MQHRHLRPLDWKSSANDQVKCERRNSCATGSDIEHPVLVGGECERVLPRKLLLRVVNPLDRECRRGDHVIAATIEQESHAAST
jgi:hypothetical protein